MIGLETEIKSFQIPLHIRKKAFCIGTIHDSVIVSKRKVCHLANGDVIVTLG